MVDSEADIEYEEDHHAWLSAIFGCEQHGQAVQYVGDILAKEGRLIAFPNVFQRRLLPFELADPTSPGHMKILALFLVDPHMEIISSARVPCQRRDWWAEELRRSHSLGNLPVEILQEITRDVEDFPVSLEEANKSREEMMDERTRYGEMLDRAFQANIFNLSDE